MGIVSTGMPSGDGPHASADFGTASQTSALEKQLQSQAGTKTPSVEESMKGGPQGQPPQQPQGDPGATQPQASSPSPGKPFNDTGVPRGKDGRLDLSKSFSDLTTVHNWRSKAAIWASHPEAGDTIKQLGRLARLDHGGGPQVPPNKGQ